MQSLGMRQVALFFAVVTLLLYFTPLALSGQAVPRDRDEREARIAGQYIVVLNDSVANVGDVEKELISQVRGTRIASYRNAFNGFAARFSDIDAATIAEDPRVAFVSQDRKISIIEDAGGVRSFFNRSRRGTPPPAAPSPAPSPSPSPTPSPPPPPADSPDNEASAEAVRASAQTLPNGINRIDAETVGNAGAGVHVAIIDTGIQLNHPDLKANIVGGKNCSTGASYTDGNGHGTHVAGTIAALDNGLGVVGVAPSAKLWAIRVLNNSGGGSWSTVICGLDFVTANAPKNGGPIKVANLSLGGGGANDNNCGNSNNDALHKAICRARDAGVTVIVAAGNSGVNAANFVPAAYDDAVIAVSALNDTNGKPNGGGLPNAYGIDDTFASFSNWGTPVDIGAPGTSIYSTWINSTYKSISGTSMASPHVAGAAARYLSANPGALWGEVRAALISAAEKLGNGHTDPSKKHPEPVLQVDSL